MFLVGLFNSFFIQALHPLHEKFHEITNLRGFKISWGDTGGEPESPGVFLQKLVEVIVGNEEVEDLFLM